MNELFGKRPGEDYGGSRSNSHNAAHHNSPADQRSTPYADDQQVEQRLDRLLHDPALTDTPLADDAPDAFLRLLVLAERDAAPSAGALRAAQERVWQQVLAQRAAANQPENGILPAASSTVERRHSILPPSRRIGQSLTLAAALLAAAVLGVLLLLADRGDSRISAAIPAAPQTQTLVAAAPATAAADAGYAVPTPLARPAVPLIPVVAQVLQDLPQLEQPQAYQGFMLPAGGAFTSLGTLSSAPLLTGGGIISVMTSTAGHVWAVHNADNRLLIWNQDGAQSLLLGLGAYPVTGMALAPQGDALALGSVDGRVQLVSAAQGTVTAVLQDPLLDAGQPVVVAGSSLDTRSVPHTLVAYNRDGSRLASAGVDMRRQIYVWDTAQNSLLLSLGRAEFGSEAVPRALALNPAGTLLAVGHSSGTVTLVSLDDTRLRPLAGSQQGIAQLAFSPNGRLLAVAGSGVTLRVWDVNSGEQHFALNQPVPALALAFSPDSTLLVLALADGSVWLLDTAQGSEQLVFAMPAPVSSISFAPQARGVALLLAGADGTLTLWSLQPAMLPGDVTGKESYN